MIDIKTIYLQKSASNYSTTLEILNKYNNAKVKKVDSHWKIPELENTNLTKDWLKYKRNTLIIGIKSGMYIRPNCRSTDFVGVSHTNSCALACSYCYTNRRKGPVNPITIFANIDQIIEFTRKHFVQRGAKTTPNQCDPKYWTYDIGENCDCSVDATISRNVEKIIRLFAESKNAKASFATKWVNRDLLNIDPKGRTRIRFSLMPQPMSTKVDIRTSKIVDRINAINDFVAAGYEVHINLSPVVIYKKWLSDYAEMFDIINDTLNEKSKQQLQAEVIFLTHNKKAHENNMIWHPKGENRLWVPAIQEEKKSETGGINVRYKREFKSKLINEFKKLMKQKIPYCNIRYIF